jgi:glycosyltransferase involved in cell wall biosynthesis
MEKYSVLTTIYKNEKPENLRQCLDSMLEQTVPPNEYVIVEDGPIGSELQSVIDEYCNNFDIFKIVTLSVNSGCGKASIAGMSACTNDLIARIDSDDISLPERCELELQMFQKDKDLVVVGSDIIEFENDPNVIVSIKKMPYSPEEIYKYGKRRNPMNHSTVMMRKSIVEKYGGYAPLRRSLDLELFTKLLANGCKFKNIDKPLVKFRTGTERVKRKKNWTNFKCDMAVYKKNYKNKYIGIIDYIIVLLRQVVFFIMPTKIAGLLYSKIYRKSFK